jgi:hypothetical protein
MLKRLFLVALAGLVLNLACAMPVAARGQQEKDAKRVAKVKQQIVDLGTGTRAKVEVKLRDKTKVAGFVSEIGDDHFAVTDEKTNTATTVQYAQVEKVRPTPSLQAAVKDLTNTRTGKAVTVGLGILAGVLLVATLVLAPRE